MLFNRLSSKTGLSVICFQARGEEALRRLERKKKKKKKQPRVVVDKYHRLWYLHPFSSTTLDFFPIPDKEVSFPLKLSQPPQPLHQPFPSNFRPNFFICLARFCFFCFKICRFYKPVLRLRSGTEMNNTVTVFSSGPGSKEVISNVTSPAFHSSLQIWSNFTD